MNMKSKIFGLTLATLLTFVILNIIYAKNKKEFDNGCFNHLTLASHSGTIETSIKEIDISISYLESHGLVKGSTDIWFVNPKNDIGWFYQNLKSTKNELAKLELNGSVLEKSNALLKLKEVTEEYPEEIWLYPNQGRFIFLDLVSFIASMIFIVLSGVYSTKRV